MPSVEQRERKSHSTFPLWYVDSVLGAAGQEWGVLI